MHEAKRAWVAVIEMAHVAPGTILDEQRPASPDAAVLVAAQSVAAALSFAAVAAVAAELVVVLAAEPVVVLAAVAAGSAAGLADATAEVVAHMAYASAVLVAAAVASSELRRLLVHVGETVAVMGQAADKSVYSMPVTEAVGSAPLHGVHSVIYEAVDPQARH